MALPENVIALRPVDDDLPRVSPGEYTAVYVRHAGAVVFRTPKLRVDFRLVEHLDVVLSRWYRVTNFRGGRISAGRHSDLTRELSAVLGRRVRPDRIPVGLFAETYVTVKVRDVVTDGKQAGIAPVNQYSVIDAVIGRAL